MKKIVIRECMTRSPHTIGEDVPLMEATEKMKSHNIRHLPVLVRGKVVGILSERDVQLILAVYPHPKELVVGDAMVESPYTVTSDTPIEEVLQVMGENKYGSVVIVDNNNNVEGIFTEVDAILAFRAHLGAEQEEFKQQCCKRH